MRENCRGVSPVIGFILLLQIMIIFLAFVQTTLIPDQLKKIEADNVRALKSEFDKFSAMVSSGESAYLAIKTPQYPKYLFLLTPEPAGFSIRMEPFPINVSMNVTLPNGTVINVKRQFESARIYVTMENYFYPDTTFVFENTAVFQETNGRTAVVGDQKMVRNGINLVIIQGQLSSAYNSPHEFAFHVVSSGGRYYAENITVEFTSHYPDYWRSLGYIVSGDKITIRVPSGFFSATLLSPVEKESEEVYAMLKTNPFDSYTLSAGDSQEFGVLLVDRYLNPLPGKTVNVSVTGGIGSAVPSQADTDVAGVARTTFRATNPGNGAITFTYQNLSESYQITVKSTGATSGSILTVSWLNSSATWDAGAYGTKRLLAVRVSDASGNPLPSITVSFAVSNTSVVELNATSTTTNSDGIAYVSAFARANGSVNIYAFAGDAGDVLSLDVVNVTAFWLTGWNYRVPITIQENSGNSLTDYQVLVTLNTSFNWSAANSDGSDIRFTDDLGNPLNYWIEEWNYNSGAKIWVKVPNIPAGSTTTIYMYYGNPAASSESNGASTFIFFDHFDSDSRSLYTVWESWSGANPTFIWNPANSEVTSDTSNADYFLTANVNLPQSFAVEVRAYTGDDDALGALMKTASGEFYIASMRVSHYDGTGISGTEETLLKYNAPPTYYWQATLLSSLGDVVNPSSWQVAGIAYYNGYISALYNHAKSGSYYVGTIAPEFPGLSSQANNPPAHYDWILVRKYVDPEPTTIIGSEEVFGQ